jgi:hypothetical protein
MHITPKSSVVERIGYNPETRRLRVRFNQSPDTLYIYRDVPRATGKNLIRAATHPRSSVGTLLNYNVLFRKYKFSKRNQPLKNTMRRFVQPRRAQ